MLLDRCDELFEAIRSSGDAGRIANAYGKLFEFYPLLNYQIGRGSVYWRGRICPPSGYPSAAELGCPPSHLCKVGRLNHAGGACFYAATRRTTVFTEIHAQPGDYVHLVGIRFVAGKSIRIVAIGDLFHVYKTGYARSIGKDPQRAVSKMLNQTDRDRAVAILYVDAFLSHILSDQHAREKEYLPTRVLAEMAYKKSGARGMFYPSVQDHIGMNLALLREPYESCTQITTSQVVRITSKRDFGFFDVEPVLHATGVAENGRFEWGGEVADQRVNFFNLTAEEAEFAAGRDPDDPNTLLDLVSLSSQLRDRAADKRGDF